MTEAVYPSLNGKAVLITGGGSGIGEAIVQAFAGQGSKVGFLDIADEPSEHKRHTSRQLAQVNYSVPRDEAS